MGYPSALMTSFPALILVLVPLLIWGYFLFEILMSNFQGNEGMLWALLVFFVPFIGLLAYLAYGRSKRLKKK